MSKPLAHERRRTSDVPPPEFEQMHEDRRTKRVPIYTICGVVWMFSMTMCYLALRQLAIPPEVKDMLLYFAGVLSGMLIKTGADAIAGRNPQPAGTAADPVKTEIVNTTDNPAKTEDVNATEEAKDGEQ